MEEAEIPAVTAKAIGEFFGMLEQELDCSGWCNQYPEKHFSKNVSGQKITGGLCKTALAENLENLGYVYNSVTGVCFRGDEAFSRGDATDLG